MTAHFATSYSFLRKLNISPRKLEEGSKGSKGKAQGTNGDCPFMGFDYWLKDMQVTPVITAGMPE